MQEQIGAKIGAFVFFCFGVLTLVLGVWGMTTQYDQGGILTWGIVLGFGLIFSLAGIILFVNSMNGVSDRIKQLLNYIIGALVFLCFGFVGLFVKGLGIMRLVLSFFGVIGVLLLIQGIRNFRKGDSADANQTSDRIQWSGDVGGSINMNGQEMDGGYNRRFGYDDQYTSYESSSVGNNSPDADVRQDEQWKQEASGTPFSGSAGGKVYTSQVNGGGTEYGSGMTPEFDQMMAGMGMNSEQQEKTRKIGSVIQKGTNIYAGVICVVVGVGFILANGIIVLNFINMLIQAASLTTVMDSLFPAIMSVVMLIIGVFMIVRGVKLLRGK